MSRLWWVRHGPTHRKCMVGWSDVAADLSDAAAIGRLSDYLPRRAALISSDLARARATADALAAPGRHRLPDNAALREINFGAWELLSFEQIEAQDPARVRAFMETPGDVTPPGGGESWKHLAARLDPAVADLVSRGEDVIVVAHFGPIIAQIERALGITAYQAFAHRIDPLSVTEVTVTRDIWRIGAINHRP